MIQTTLDNLLEDLLGTRTQAGILRHPSDTDPVLPNREQKLAMVLPSDFLGMIKEHKSSYKSYYTWLLNGNCQANRLRKDAILFFTQNTELIVDQTEQLVNQLLYDVHGRPSFEDARLIEYLYQDVIQNCFRSRSTEYSRYLETYLYFVKTDPVRALVILILHFFFAERTHTQNLLSIDAVSRSYHNTLNLLFSLDYKGQSPIDRSIDANAHFLYARLLYLQGDKKKGLDLLQMLEHKKYAPDQFQYQEELYYLLADSYRDHLSSSANETKYFTYLLHSCRYGNMAAYDLYLCYLRGIGCNKDGKKAADTLKKASTIHNYRALRDLGNAYYIGDSFLELPADRNLACYYFEQGTIHIDESYIDGTCHFMLGKIRQQEGKMEEADRLYETAARMGHAAARAQLLRRKPGVTYRSMMGSIPDQTQEYSRTSTRKTLAFFMLHSPEDQELTSILDTYVDESKKADNLRFVLDELQQLFTSTEDTSTLPHILFYFFSEDYRSNVKDAMDTMDYLSSYLENPNSASYIQEYTELFVRTDDTVAIHMIDSLISNLEPLYLKVRICNEYLDSANRLLFQAPLFLQDTQKNVNHENRQPLHIILKGNGKAIHWLLRAIMSICIIPTSHGRDRKKIDIPYHLHLTIIDPDADKVEDALRKECPGLFSSSALMTSCLYFHKQVPDKANIADCSYYIVAYDDSWKNLHQAMELRENLLREDVRFEQQPFIAAYCCDSRLYRHASHLSTGNNFPDYSWYNNYNIYLFGSLAENYRYPNISNNYPDRLAWEIHQIYSPSHQSPAQTAYTFFSSYYNRDSSRSGGLAMVYHLYSLNIQLRNWRDYGHDNGLRGLAEQYTQWLDQHNQQSSWIDMVCRNEHNRWNIYMMTRGWIPASVAQMEEYMQKGTLKHHLTIARMHPYIADWKALGDEYNGIQREINQALLRLDPEANLPDIKGSYYSFLYTISSALKNILDET